ncbi:MAG: hypothetical protein IRY91_16180 [Gemmatimonadaceae bacterium]|nr:hypothetical protein [Gemmatimonadaceae bacterium]
MRIALVAALVALAACAPKAPPLAGVPAPARLPATALPPVHRQLTFRWSYADPDLQARGEGAARVAPPDSVRLDLFLGNGVSGGRAILIGDSLETPDGDRVRSYLPPVPLLWAALGRLHVAPAPDTVARVDGDTLRVEIGHNPVWRAAFVHDELRRVDLIEGGRIRQSLTLDAGAPRGQAGHIQYTHTGARRKLELTIVRVDTVSGFDAAIWR